MPTPDCEQGKFPVPGEYKEGEASVRLMVPAGPSGGTPDKSWQDMADNGR